MADLAFYRLQQLINPNLPIGGFTYSQGIEWAVEEKWITNRQESLIWLEELLGNSLETFDLPLLSRLYTSVKEENVDSFHYYAQLAYAGRETKELRLEDTQCAEALIRVLSQLGEVDTWPLWPLLFEVCKKTLLAPFAMAGCYWKISLEQVLAGFLWSWLENRVACLVKVVPLGQSDGQWLLHSLSETLDETIKKVLTIEDNALGSSAFGMVLASCQHETQYCRLFRS
jgi:urease accessory protein